jgi:hypothetical protein
MEDLRFKNYFLGKLTPAEVEELELEIISSSEFETELQMAESNLIEDYLEESLNSDDKKAFQQNYLISNDRFEQVEITRQLKIYSQKQPIAENHPSFFEKIKTFFSWRPMMAATAGLVLILVLAIGWKLLFNSNQTGLETELVALNKQDLSNLEEFRGITNLSLISGQLRSEGNLKSVSSNKISELVLLRLALPVKVDPPKTLLVQISRDNKILYNLQQVTYQNQEVRLLLPKSILNKSEYQITIENGAENYNYFFIVQ